MRVHDHVLVVDDDRIALDALAALLRDEGYRVTTATDGEQALDAVTVDPPALVISDVQMPRSDGYQLVRRLRARPATRHLPILLVSALGQPSRRVIGLDLGADDFLTKPIDLGELLARVRVHLRHAHDRDELERRTRIDALTGAANRRGITSALRRELARGTRGGGAVTVLMVDVDRFKVINDRHGHAAGDTVLRHVARFLADAVREVDHVGRYGGDEFLVVLSDTDAGAAELLLQRLRASHLPVLSFDDEDVQVTVSIGAASHVADETADALIARADAEMYRVKQTHRP